MRSRTDGPDKMAVGSRLWALGLLCEGDGSPL
jgi:hypothetical protein